MPRTRIIQVENDYEPLEPSFCRSHETGAVLPPRLQYKNGTEIAPCSQHLRRTITEAGLDKDPRHPRQGMNGLGSKWWGTTPSTIERFTLVPVGEVCRPGFTVAT